MASLGVCANLQTQRLCLSSSLKRSAVMMRDCALHNKIPLSNATYVHRTQNRFSATLLNSTNVVVKQTRTFTFLDRTSKIGFRQYATAAPLHSERSEEGPRNEPDDRPALDGAVSHVKDKQVQTPWQREGSQTPPVRRERDASAMTKGKLLTSVMPHMRESLVVI